MIEIKEEQSEKAHLQQLGEAWIRSIMDGSMERLETFCVPGVSSQVLTPRRFATLDTAAALVERYRHWFGACTNFRVEASRIDTIGERLGIFYRFLLQEEGAWYHIEQQLYCTLQDGRIVQLHLLCSGFQLVAEHDEVKPKSGQESPPVDQLLELYSGPSGAESICAVLTPSIRAKLREMQTGQVLEVRVDDPAARGDIESWSRLSGNELLGVVEEDTHILRFFLKKK